MGNSQATPTNASSQSASRPDISQNTDNRSGVDPNNKTTNQCPVSKVTSVDGGGKCPISFFSTKPNEDSATIASSSGTYKNPTVYNVYSQKIDSSNQMPAIANQSPSAEQQEPLSTERKSSSIPKGGTDNDTWLYPSPQMFWNALARKDKLEGVTERHVDTVVAIHNNMNENTWKQVLEWEKLHGAADIESQDGRAPKLLKFIGRPDELSPKAKMKMLFGHPAPFDRHDWTVDRGGRLVRYIIDYYHDESAINKDATPRSMADAHAMQSIKVEVRPALDSLQAVADRVWFMPLEQFRGGTTYKAPDFFPPSAMQVAEIQRVRKIDNHWENIQEKCVMCKQKVAAAGTVEEQGAAAVELRKCIAEIVCPVEAADFIECSLAHKIKAAAGGVNEESLRRVSLSYSSMLKCLELFEVESKNIRR